MSKEVHAEIEYGEGPISIHSDVCPPGCSSDGLGDPEWRKFIHEVLDEWLDKSKGTGAFYIKEANHDFKGHLRLIRSMAEKIRGARREISENLLGSCRCLTKSNDDSYHAPDCPYRVLKEILKKLS